MSFAETDAWVAARLGDKCIQCGGVWYPPVGPRGNEKVPRGSPCGACAAQNRCGCRATGRHCCEHPKACNCGAKEPRLPYGHTAACAYVTDYCDHCREDEGVRRVPKDSIDITTSGHTETDPDPTEKCPRCDGCGWIAATETGEPWSAWTALPVHSAAAVLAGIVGPIPCPDCHGTGAVMRDGEARGR